MKKTNLVVAAITLSLVAMPALAQVKLGFVNGQKVINDSPQAIKAKKKIEGQFEKRDQELQALAKRLQGMQEALEKNALTMSETDKRVKEREFNDKNIEFQRKQREFREDLNLKQNEEMAGIYERVNKAIKQVAEAEKYDLILQEAVYINPKFDITEKVIKALGDGSK